MIRRLFVILLFSLLLTACGGRAETTGVARDTAPAGEFGGAEEMAEAEEPVDADGAAFNATTNQAAQDTGTADIPQQRLIIRTGNLSIVVEDTEAALDEIAQLAESSGGWVVSSSVRQFSEGMKTATITVRVPSEGFNDAMEAIKETAVSVSSESTSGQDVTEEFVDLSARLDNLEATADRVRGFLDDTQDVEEALAVNQELSRLEEEIERIKGRMQYLQQSASFSTITVDITPDALSQPLEIGGWQPQGVAKDAIETLINALQGLANIVIWLALFVLPLALAVLVPFYFVVRFVWRRIRRRRQQSQPQATE